MLASATCHLWAAGPETTGRRPKERRVMGRKRGQGTDLYRPVPCLLRLTTGPRPRLHTTLAILLNLRPLGLTQHATLTRYIVHLTQQHNSGLVQRLPRRAFSEGCRVYKRPSAARQYPRVAASRQTTLRDGARSAGVGWQELKVVREKRVSCVKRSHERRGERPSSSYENLLK